MMAAMSSGQPMRLSTTPETTPSPAVKQVYKIFTTRVHALAGAPAFALVSEFRGTPTRGSSRIVWLRVHESRFRSDPGPGFVL